LISEKTVKDRLFSVEVLLDAVPLKWFELFFRNDRNWLGKRIWNFCKVMIPGSPLFCRNCWVAKWKILKIYYHYRLVGGGKYLKKLKNSILNEITKK